MGGSNENTGIRHFRRCLAAAAVRPSRGSTMFAEIGSAIKLLGPPARHHHPFGK